MLKLASILPQSNVGGGEAAIENLVRDIVYECLQLISTRCASQLLSLAEQHAAVIKFDLLMAADLASVFASSIVNHNRTLSVLDRLFAIIDAPRGSRERALLYGCVLSQMHKSRGHTTLATSHILPLLEHMSLSGLDPDDPDGPVLPQLVQVLVDLEMHERIVLIVDRARASHPVLRLALSEALADVLSRAPDPAAFYKFINELEAQDANLSPKLWELRLRSAAQHSPDALPLLLERMSTIAPDHGHQNLLLSSRQQYVRPLEQHEQQQHTVYDALLSRVPKHRAYQVMMRLFRRMPEMPLAAWNALLAHLVSLSDTDRTATVLDEMHRLAVPINAKTAALHAIMQFQLQHNDSALQLLDALFDEMYNQLATNTTAATATATTSATVTDSTMPSLPRRFTYAAISWPEFVDAIGIVCEHLAATSHTDQLCKLLEFAASKAVLLPLHALNAAFSLAAHTASIRLFHQLEEQRVLLGLELPLQHYSNLFRTLSAQSNPPLGNSTASATGRRKRRNGTVASPATNLPAATELLESYLASGDADRVCIERLFAAALRARHVALVRMCYHHLNNSPPACTLPSDSSRVPRAHVRLLTLSDGAAAKRRQPSSYDDATAASATATPSSKPWQVWSFLASGDASRLDAASIRATIDDLTAVGFELTPAHYHACHSALTAAGLIDDAAWLSSNLDGNDREPRSQSSDPLP